MRTSREYLQMKRSFPLSLFLAATVACSPLAFAASGPQAANPATPATSAPMQHARWHGMGHRHGHHGAMRMLDELGLSDAQRTSIQQMMHESFEQARPEMQALRQKRMAWEAATPGSSAYQRAVDDLAAAEANAARQRVVRHAALRTRIYGVLTPQQRTRLASMRAEHETRMQQWRSDHGKHSPAPASAGSSD